MNGRGEVQMKEQRWVTGKENMLGLQETVPKGCFIVMRLPREFAQLGGVQGDFQNMVEQGSAQAFVSNGIT